MAGVTFLAILVSAVFLVDAHRVARQVPLEITCGEGRSNYTVVPKPDTPTIFRSNNYGKGTYGPNEECFVQIRTERTSIIKLFYREFSLEFSRQCQWDFFCVDGVNFCGDQLANYTLAYVVPGGKTLTLLFRSDLTVPGKGFEISVEVSYSDVVLEQPYKDSCEAKISPDANDDYDYSHIDYDYSNGQDSSESNTDNGDNDDGYSDYGDYNSDEY